MCSRGGATITPSILLYSRTPKETLHPLVIISKYLYPHSPGQVLIPLVCQDLLILDMPYKWTPTRAVM